MIVSVLLVGLGMYLLNDNNLLGLKPTDGVYVFVLGALVLVVGFIKSVPNKN